jgi:hypothetical protein
MENFSRDHLRELVGIHAVMIQRLLLDQSASVLITLFRDVGTTYLEISASIEKVKSEAEEN